MWKMDEVVIGGLMSMHRCGAASIELMFMMKETSLSCGIECK